MFPKINQTSNLSFFEKRPVFTDEIYDKMIADHLRVVSDHIRTFCCGIVYNQN